MTQIPMTLLNANISKIYDTDREKYNKLVRNYTLSHAL